MSSKVDLLKKQIAELQAHLEVQKAKNANVSDGTLPIDIGKEKPYWNEQPPKERSLWNPHQLVLLQSKRFTCAP